MNVLFVVKEVICSYWSRNLLPLFWIRQNLTRFTRPFRTARRTGVTQESSVQCFRQFPVLQVLHWCNNTVFVWTLKSIVSGAQSLIYFTELPSCSHCINIWVTSTIFWSSQLHACCVHDTLQSSTDASNLIESLSVVETLLIFIKWRSSCRKPSYVATFLP